MMDGACRKLIQTGWILSLTSNIAHRSSIKDLLPSNFFFTKWNAFILIIKKKKTF